MKRRGMAFIIIAILIPLLFDFAMAAPTPTPEPVNPTTLDITTIPDGASVYLNGTFYGDTPISIKSIESGEYILVIKKSDYEVIDQLITVDSKNNVFSFELKHIEQESPSFDDTFKVIKSNGVVIIATKIFSAGLLPDGELALRGGWVDVGNAKLDSADSFDDAILVNVTNENPFALANVDLFLDFDKQNAAKVRNVKIYETTDPFNSLQRNYTDKTGGKLLFNPQETRFYKIYFQRSTFDEISWNFTLQISGRNITLDPTVSSCGNIASAGIYTVTSLLTAPAGKTCLNVTSSNVLINGQGFAITGNNAAGTAGINISNGLRQNVTVGNFSNIQGFQYGIYLNNTVGVVLINITMLTANGGQGGAGVAGRSIYGVYAWNSTLASFVNLTLKGLWAGSGGTGSSGGAGGNGGDAYGIFGVLNNSVLDGVVVSNLTGGLGGKGGGFNGIAFGNGGNGGSASGISLNSVANLTISNSNITIIMAGYGGASGGEGSEEIGGVGGNSFGINLTNSRNSSIVNTSILNLTGGRGGNGDIVGNDGNAGNAYGIYLLSWNVNITATKTLNVSFGFANRSNGGSANGSAFALYFDSANLTTITNSSLNTSYLLSGSVFDVYSNAFSQNNVFVNTSYYNKTFWGWGTGTNNFTWRWYVQVNITNQTFSAISGASVNISNASAVNTPEILNNLTDANGLSGWFTLTEFIGNKTVNTSYTPHNFTGFKSAFTGNSTNATITSSQIILLILPTPAGAATISFTVWTLGGVGNSTNSVTGIASNFTEAYYFNFTNQNTQLLNPCAGADRTNCQNGMNIPAYRIRNTGNVNTSIFINISSLFGSVGNVIKVCANSTVPSGCPTTTIPNCDLSGTDGNLNASFNLKILGNLGQDSACYEGNVTLYMNISTSFIAPTTIARTLTINSTI